VDRVILRCPKQALTLAETVYAHAAGAAYASGEERIKGTLSPGNLADLAVLSQDIIALDPMAILETEALATLFDGEVVYQHEQGVTSSENLGTR
jgi:predicted amidohydrolase YtcJ